jgi:hypothetical protein
MCTQPIAGIDWRAGLQALYGKLPQVPSKQNIADFFTSKYGLGIVVGGTTLATLLLARMWYQSWQKAAEEQMLQQRIQAALKHNKALDIIIVLDDLYKQYGWEEFHKQIIAAVPTELSISGTSGAKTLGDFIAKNKDNYSLCKALYAEIQYIEEGQGTSNVPIQKKDTLNLLYALIKLAVCRRLLDFRSEVAGTVALSSYREPLPTAAVAVRQPVDTQDPEKILSDLYDLYWKNKDWLSYTNSWGEQRANNLLKYLSIKTDLRVLSFTELIGHIQNQSAKRSICGVLHIERYKLSKMAEQNVDTKAAFVALSSLIEGWKCGKFPQTIPEIISELDLLYQDQANNMGKNFTKKVVTLLQARGQVLSESEVREALNDENHQKCELVYSIIRNTARKELVEQSFFDAKRYILLLIDHLLDLVLCKKAVEAAE